MNGGSPASRTASGSETAAGVQAPVSGPVTATTTNDTPRPNPVCLNCRSPLLGDFCYECGQPKKGWIRHIHGIVGDFLDSVLNFDSRTLRTLAPLLLRPGYLSNEYFAGRRVRYVTPLRLYVFMSVVAFLLVGWNAEMKPGEGFIRVGKTSSESSTEQRLKELNTGETTALAGLSAAKSFMPAAEYDKAVADIKADFAKDRAEVIADAAKERQKAADEKTARETGKSPPTLSLSTEPPGPPPPPKPPGAAGDKTPVDAEMERLNPQRMEVFTDGPWHPTRNPAKVDWLGETGNAWLNAKIGVMIRNGEVVNKEPQKLIAEMFKEAPTVLFILLPFFALLLKCFYIFKRRFYMEHLIVALHSHSFICFSIILIAAMVRLDAWLDARVAWLGSLSSLIIAGLWIWMPIYLFLAQKRIYRQGYIMTTLKFGMIGFCYLFMLILGLFVLLLSSLVNL